MKNNTLLKRVRKETEKNRLTDEQMEWPHVAILTGPMEVIEIIVLHAIEGSGIFMNWHYVGGRAVVRTENTKDIPRCRYDLKLSCPDGDLTTNDLCFDIPQKL